MNERWQMYAVTGAFGYSGSYIAKRLLGQGAVIRTLTNSPGTGHPLKSRVESFPLNFGDMSGLQRALEGCDTLFNTYWVRFNHANFDHTQAVTNTIKLFQAAKSAGVRRIVHTSITNPSKNSPLSYFQGKAVLEENLMQSGLSYAILRPTVLFGREDILVNNTAWGLRTFPIFPIFGDGAYKLQPIFVDDFAALAVRMSQTTENATVDAIGPETFTFRELVNVIRVAIGSRSKLVSVPVWLGHLGTKLIGATHGDVTLTREELVGLMGNLLYTTSKPAGNTKLSEWVVENRSTIGRTYASELSRRVQK